MKRLWIAGLLSVCLVLPALSQTKRYSVKIAMGTLGSAALDGIYVNTENYWNAESVRPYKDNDGGLDFGLEFGYDFIPHLTLAIGGSYWNKGLNGDVGTLTHPADTGLTGSLAYNPHFIADIFSVYLNVTYEIPVREAFGLSIFGGGGYYFGDVTMIEEGMDLQNPDDSPGFQYFSERFKSKLSSPGFHLGASLNLNVNDGLALFVEGIYRILEFKDFDSKSLSELNVPGITPEGRVGDKNTFMFGNSYDPVDIYGDILYNVSAMAFKGFEFRGGMKIRF